MPSGRQHRKLATATTPLVVLGGWVVSGFAFDFETWSSITIVVGGYLMNPVMLSPDIDLVHSDPSNIYGKAEPIWWGYQALIHRGPLSHLPPLSSILRVFYLWLALFVVGTFAVGILNLIWYGLFDEILMSWDWIKTAFGGWLLIFTFPQFWQFVWGICIADLLHTGADISYSFMRK